MIRCFKPLRDLWSNGNTTWRERIIKCLYNVTTHTSSTSNYWKCFPGGRPDGPKLLLHTTSLWNMWAVRNAKVMKYQQDTKRRWAISYSQYCFNPFCQFTPSPNQMVIFYQISRQPWKSTWFPTNIRPAFGNDSNTAVSRWRHIHRALIFQGRVYVCLQHCVVQWPRLSWQLWIWFL